MKAVNFWKTLFCAALAITAFSACSDDDNDDDGGIPSITVDGKESATLAVKLEGGTTEAVEVVSTGNWVLELSGTETGWCHPSKETGGKGKTSLTFTVDKWEGAASTDERSVTATLTTNGSFEGIPIPKKATIVVKQNGDGSTAVTTNVKEIRTKIAAIATESGVSITEDLTLTGIVVSDVEAGGFAGNRNCVVVDNSTEAGAGIIVRFPTTGYTFPVGQVITGSIKGAKAAISYGVIQIDLDGSSVAFSEVPGTTVDVQPIPVAAADLATYESQYVRVNEVQPIASARGKKFYEGTASYTTTKFETKNGVSLDISIYKTNSWAKETTVPSNSGYVCGLVSIFNGAGQVAPRNAKDVAGLTEALFQETGPVTSTIGGITEAGKYKVENAIVAANYQSGFVMEDATGQMLVYQFLSGSTITIPAVGAKVTVTGTVELKNGMLQFSPEGLDVTTDGTGTVKPQTATELDGAAVTSLFNTPVMKYVKYAGKLTVSGNYYNVAINDTEVVGSISYPNDDLNVKSFDGQQIILEGWFIGATTASDGTKYFTTLLTKISANTNVPNVVAPESAIFKAEGETQEISYTATGMGSNGVYAKITGTDAAQFEITSAPANGKLSVKALANSTSTLKSATLTIFIATSQDADESAYLASAIVTLTQSPAGVTNYVPLTAAPADWSGTYVVGYPNNDVCYILKDKYSGATATKSTFTYDELKSPAFDGTNIAYDASYNTVTIAKISGTDFYSIKYGDMYVGWTTSTANSCQFTEAAPSASTPDYQWTPTFEEGLVVLTCSTQGSSDKKPRTFQFNSNSGQERFAIYASTQKFVMLYKLQ